MSTKESNNADSKASGDVSSKRRKAGFWSVLLMVIGVQLGGVSTVWNIGATEGLKKLFLGHALVGLMYVLLAVCFAELTSVVPFAGGSFGFCRAALGPFWGFMVGASEVLENIMKVVVCVYLIATACTTVFKTKAHFTPLYMLACYVLLFAIHLQGGSFFWNTIIILGLISIGTVLMFCIGNTKDIDVELYGQIDNSTFEGHGKEFLTSLYLVIWVYIGLEIVPQTCERVKEVHKNLPRALVLGTLFTYGLIFWVIVAVVCNAPGYLYPRAWIGNPFPFTIGFIQMFDTPDFLFYGPLFAIIPLFASALTFMWGCGYQVASLARSGLLPSVFATTYGENETPVVALGLSAVIQFLMCLGNQRIGTVDGIKTCYTTMMVGATFVYIGVFIAFIVFRTHFSGMKRHWVSPVGIPGALVGISMAVVLCISVIVLEPYPKALETYFAFMGCAVVYYVLYARHTQFFSKEEQKKFLKAYIVNANNSRGKPKSARQKMMEKMLAPVNRFFALSSSVLIKSQTGASPVSMASSASNVSAVVSKHNSISPAPKVPAIEIPSKADVELRAQEPTRGTTGNFLKAVSPKIKSNAVTPTTRGTLRSSFSAASGSTKVGWSGQAMTMTESKKFLEVLMSAPDDVTGQLAESLPNQFMSLGVDEAAMAVLLAGGELPEDHEVYLGDLVEGAYDDDDHDHALSA